MNHKITRIHPADNVLVALTNLEQGEQVVYNGEGYLVPGRVPAKHKFVMNDMEEGDSIIMYGVLVGKTRQPLQKGTVITVSNVKHAASEFTIGKRNLEWHLPDNSKFKARSFNGFLRPDGKLVQQIIGWLYPWYFAKIKILILYGKHYWRN